MELYLNILFPVLFFTYIGYVWIKYGILNSISESYYKLPPNEKWLFTAFCFGFGLLAALQGALDGSLLMFLSGSLACFIGASPNFKRKGVKWVHMTAAYGAGTLSQLALLFDYGGWRLVLITAISFILLFIFKRSVKEIFWIELIVFTTAIIGMAL